MRVTTHPSIALSWRPPLATLASLCGAEGDVDKAFAGAAQRVSAEYYIPHLSHAPMEPPCAVARVADGTCEVWACTQDPQSARNLLAKLLGLPTERVTVNVTLLGGGFGRKSRPDFVVEAALVSRTLAGKPVKLTWTREDDLVNDYFHTVSVEHLEAGLDESHKTVAWLHRTVAPTIASLGSSSDPQHELAFELGMGVTDLPFAIPEHSAGKPGRRCTYAHQLVARRLKHPTCVRDPVVRCRARCRGWS